jgi:hypothetical protein
MASIGLANKRSVQQIYQGASLLVKRRGTGKCISYLPTKTSGMSYPEFWPWLSKREGLMLMCNQVIYIELSEAILS